MLLSKWATIQQLMDIFWIPPPPGQETLSVILGPINNGGEPQQEKHCIIDYPITNRARTLL